MGAKWSLNGLAKEYKPMYKTWWAMLIRCNNPDSPKYHRYGGRGISVCGEWSSFTNFCGWSLSNGWDGVRTLDRINNDGNYEPSNCRWATKKEQSRNTSQNVRHTFNGESLTIPEWAEKMGMKATNIHNRLRNGWSLEDALNTPPVSPTRFLTANGKTKNLSQWAAELGIPADRIYLRMRRGWNMMDAVFGRTR